MRWLDGITESMDMHLGGLWELVMATNRPGVLEIHGVTKSQTRLSDWSDIYSFYILDSMYKCNI